MNKYKVIDHPSDIGMEATGKDIKELFQNAAYGMMDMAFELKAVKPEKEFSVKVAGDTTESLLVNWLSELLYICDSKKVAIIKVNIDKMTDNSLEARIFGGKIGNIKRFIKAATYNQLEIKKENDRWKARIIFDV